MVNDVLEKGGHTGRDASSKCAGQSAGRAVPVGKRDGPPPTLGRGTVKRGRQWIHFDAEYPLKFGHDLCDKFGPAGELLFILFLCGCKRAYPQGRIHYRTEDELRILLGAHFEFEDQDGIKWCLADFWAWCGRRKVTSRRARGGRTYVYATRWDAWEDDFNASERRNKASERKRKSRSATQNVTHVTPQRLEVRGKRLEIRGGSERGDPAGPLPVSTGLQSMVSNLMHSSIENQERQEEDE